MKKMINELNYVFLSRNELKNISGGNPWEDQNGPSDGGCSSGSCSNPNIPQDKGSCIACGDCKITYNVGGKDYSYNISSTACN